MFFVCHEQNVAVIPEGHSMKAVQKMVYVTARQGSLEPNVIDVQMVITDTQIAWVSSLHILCGAFLSHV